MHEPCPDSIAPHVVLDTSFGAGLQFLRSWQATTGSLHYLAFLAQPITLAELLQQHTGHAELTCEASALRAAWPELLPGFHRLLFAHGRISLTLMIGSLDDCLTQATAQVHAFHVDVVAATQSARRLARLAAPSAALILVDGAPDAALARAGFVFSSGTHAVFQPSRPVRAGTPMARQAIVLGAGLAGAAICERLIRRGWRVTLLERHAEAAMEASGNLAGIVMPLLSRDDNLASRLSRAAYLFAVHRWSRLARKAFDGSACGVLQLARDAEHAELQEQIARRWNYPAGFAEWLTADDAGAVLGAATSDGGWLFRQGGWAHPAGVCQALLAACGERLDMRFGVAVTALRQDGADWQLLDEKANVLAQAPTVIFANGQGATRFAQLAELPLHAVRGQVTHVAAELDFAPALVVCRESYLTPPSDGIRSVGATYDRDSDPQLRRDSQTDNLRRVQAMLPGNWPDAASLPLAGRVGFRCVAPDRLPLVGALPRLFSEIQNGPRAERLRDVPRWPGLFGLLGYASRGLIWAPLAAELLAAQLDGEPFPIESDLVAALDPARFLLKALRRPTAQAVCSRP
ncbi:FAD-dependent 5-carboxymethylaminomethyl-2-thiouridine(34) oxidoreductase MnmC [Actimicrobium antarcticum]|uniref:Bifunctional tRNA (5-methylaminomethyl-2-thiouridine)(34)-methyltransferase MnmD/FAD-dependent 5-carboxymethylaminomethyl-2-thiouridine(34) oxidoreductase MnmC n=1 Tax=Actimicrobium antarcticum TaxID=1051899 RepID=A0ABP7T4C7_9BURK